MAVHWQHGYKCVSLPFVLNNNILMWVVAIWGPVEGFLYFCELFNSAASNSHYIVSNSRMIDELQIGYDLEGGGCNLIKVLSQHLL